MQGALDLCAVAWHGEERGAPTCMFYQVGRAIVQEQAHNPHSSAWSVIAMPSMHRALLRWQTVCLLAVAHHDSQVRVLPALLRSQQGTEGRIFWVFFFRPQLFINGNSEYN